MRIKAIFCANASIDLLGKPTAQDIKKRGLLAQAVFISYLRNSAQNTNFSMIRVDEYCIF